jgi:cytochrome c2
MALYSGRRCDFGLWPKVGDAHQGSIVIGRSGCGSCHIIPGIQHADGLVGPPLTHFARRTIVAGLLPNTPSNLIHWVQEPQQVVPGNAMPNGGLDDQQARDTVAYLETLR